MPGGAVPVTLQRLLRRAAALLLVASAVTAFAVGRPATAADRPVRVAATAWYTAGSTTNLGLITIASGDLPVGRTPAGEDKRSYVALDGVDQAVTGTVQLRASSSPGTSYGVTGTILACQALEPWTPGAARDLATAPKIDCQDAPRAATTANGVVFDIGPLLTRWRAGAADHGIALVAADAPGAAWQQTFTAPDGATVGTADVAERDTSPGTAPVGDTQAAPETAGGVATFDAAESFPSPSFGSFAIDVQPPGAPTPIDTGPGTAVAPPVGRPGVVAARRPLEPLPVNPLVWVGVALGLGVLGVAGRSLGDAGRPRLPVVFGRGGGQDVWTSAPFPLSAAAVLVAALAIVVTWWGAGEQATPSTQLPYVLVGGGVGVGGVVVAGALYAAQRKRLELAEADRAAARLLEAAARLADAAASRR